ncbi:MAG TPA: hypothetical protein VGP89_19355 [Candidatus Angelobacter sp.]|jgi:hypothetical protein|nr:hypothetical protein [Candidatus Angelobacter sp.]
MIAKIAGLEKHRLAADERGFGGSKKARFGSGLLRFCLILLEFHPRAAFAGGSQQAVEGLQFSHQGKSANSTAAEASNLWTPRSSANSKKLQARNRYWTVRKS